MKRKHCNRVLTVWLLTVMQVLFVIDVAAANNNDCKEINILLYNEYPPLYWKTPDGYKGAAIKITEQFFKAMSIKINFIIANSYFKVIKSIKDEQTHLIPISNVNAPKLLSLVEPSYYKSDIGIYALNENMISLDEFTKDSLYKVSAINVDINQVVSAKLPTHHLNYRYGDINTYFRRLNKGIFRYLIADKTYFGLLSNQPDLKAIKLSDYSLGKTNIHYAFSNQYPCKKVRRDFTGFLSSLVKNKEAEEIINNAYLEYYY
ncbi:hypothetical protein [Spartinivicinus ruber]|uniref:hypothetical protein n=1 Tax=Spartinivicinus ruber TaxID=2683272 RepID=UPI0013D73A2F|nr:hypothetical protein [Spartinivicinus ruber]